MKVLHAKDSGKDLNKITYVILEWAEKKNFVVGFSGTRNLYQFFTEIVDFLPVSYSIHPEIEDAKVFDYFYKHYTNDFRDEFFEVMKSLYSDSKYSEYGIIFTGHSLGAAMAFHTVGDFVLSGIDSQGPIKDMVKSSSKPYVQVYTFGQPRVGNYAFVKPIQDKVDELYRVVHNRDFVVHAPF